MHDRDTEEDPRLSPRPPCRHLGQVLAAAVAAFPDRPAVTAVDGAISYRQLDTRTDGVAARLQHLGAGPGVLVGLYTTRSTHMVAGLVGIVKSGGAYLPIDPTAPTERVRWLLADSEAPIVVTESALLHGLSSYSGAVVVLDEPMETSDDDAPLASQRETDLVSQRETDLAYVIYTSGSTGTPKGVMVEHHSVVRLFETTQALFAFDENDTWAMFHSVAFDFSVWELWGALLHGGHLVVVPHDTARSPAAMLALLASSGISVLSQTPSAFRQLVAADSGRVALPSLRLVVLGGERLDVAMLRPWIDRRGDRNPKLVNMYGITEVTVHASYRQIRMSDLDRPDVSPIGQPLPDLRFAVLDEAGKLVEDGKPGELSIGGPGVARGYLGRADLSAARFMVSSDGSWREFRTGDRVVRRDGSHDYLGRNDDQIKVRGYRIEPREIEVVLHRHPEIAACVVAAHDYGDGDVRLAAYLVPVAGTAAADTWMRAVRADLEHMVTAALPIYMKPSAYVALAAFPMTVNGKVDRSALPKPASSLSIADDFSPIESDIADVWRRVIGLEVATRDEDFFDLGGTSLALVRMFDRVNTLFGTDLAITVLLDGATVATLASSVEAALASQPVFERAP